MKVIVEVKPINIFLSDSTCDMVIEIVRDLKNELEIELADTDPDFVDVEQLAPRPFYIEYFYLSEVAVSVKTSSKTLLTPLKYIPDLNITLSVGEKTYQMFLVEDEPSFTTEILETQINRHYRSDLNPKTLARQNLKNIGIIVQFLKVARALSILARCLRRREGGCRTGFVDLYEFLVWNLLKTGELGASLLGDLMGAFGRGL